MTESQLVLGWELTPTLEPRYWLDINSKSGHQSDLDLVRVPSSSIATHTAIIAQSGSGKSFFLGRFLEEILIKTKCRCIVLDPNADFKKVHEVASAQLWEDASYDILKRKGKLPHESSRDEFNADWSKIPIRIFTAKPPPHSAYGQIQIWWPSIGIDLISDDVEPMLRSELYHCHRFVNAIAHLSEIRCAVKKTSCEILNESSKFLNLLRTGNSDTLRAALQADFNVADLTPPKGAKDLDWIYEPYGQLFGKIMFSQKVNNRIQVAVTAAKYISEPIENFYFSKAREFHAAGIIETSIHNVREARLKSSALPLRLEVIDLPSLQDRSARFLAISSILNNEWERVRREWNISLHGNPQDDNRVPTFIIIDEAHNLIPHTPRNNAENSLREQFRRIIAEGRKYGLFLILVSQRPDKLDPLIVSECENRALMKLNSSSVLTSARTLLGLDEIPSRMIEKCLEFPTGRALLVGPWANGGSKLLFSAARRTVEGGRDLRPEYWSIPY